MPRRPFPLLLLLLGAPAVATASAREEQRAPPPPLPALGIDPGRISISGLSSGADFATQFAVAFSKTVMGLGVFAGQPFHCAVTRFPNETLLPADPRVPTCEGCPAGSTIEYDHCKHNEARVVDVKLLAAAARRLAAAGRIDDVANLRRSKIYTYAGTADSSNWTTAKNRDFFAEFVPAENLLWNFTSPSGHCWPQDSGVVRCGAANGWPMENCGYDGPGALLQHVYGDLNPPAAKQVAGSLREFDQAPFRGNNSDEVGLSPYGLVYVPQSCAADGARCALHVSLHGCTPFPDRASRYLSFNRWAESNGIVVLFPHQAAHGGAQPTHDEKGSCWDGYGQTGDAYDTRDGVQMRAIRAMVEAVARVRM